MSIGDFLTKKSDSSVEECLFDALALNNDKRGALCVYIRTILQSESDEECVQANETLLAIFPEAQTTMSLGVALWVEGKLRGSQIVEKQPINIAARNAARYAASDSRFKPVAREEMVRTRIEVTFLSLARKTAFRRFQVETDFNPKKAYKLTYREYRGWYLPEVFNCVRFRNANDFFEQLIEHKAGLDRRILKRASLEIFDTDDFVELEEGGCILKLSGPFVQRKKEYKGLDEVFLQDLGVVLFRAADHLVCVQESDGNIPAVMNPLTGYEKQIDWVRLALTTHALAAFGIMVGTNKYLVAAEKAATYIRKYGLDHPYIGMSKRMLCRVYYAEYLIAIGRHNEAKLITEEILNRAFPARFEPIFLMKMASLFLHFEGEEFLDKAKRLFVLVWDDFRRQEKRRNILQLALFPEMIVVADALYALVQDESYARQRDYLMRWFMVQQQQNGSFPSETGNMYAYVRGTGKIFEVLALRPMENQEGIIKAFGWLKDMQYVEEAVYFVRPELRERTIGGFRHDIYNQEIWIDSTAHVLIGGLRIQQKLQRVSVLLGSSKSEK